MTMNRPLVLLAGFCLVLLMALYGAHARPESDLSKRGSALKARLQTNPLSRTPDSESIHVERRSCFGAKTWCIAHEQCCSGYCSGWVQQCM